MRPRIDAPIVRGPDLSAEELQPRNVERPEPRAADQRALRRQDSAFEAPATAKPRAADDGFAGGESRSATPPLTPEERERVGTGLPPDGGVQMMWTRNDGFPDPMGLAGTQRQRAVEQGLLPADQQSRSANAANRALPGSSVTQFTADDVAAMARDAGLPLEKLDPNQLQQAARFIDSATQPQEQRDRIALSLDNLSVAAGGQAPRLSRQDAVNMLWAEAKVPGHALSGLSDAQLAAAVQDVTRATNSPGTHRLEVGSHRVELSVANDGALARTETKKPSFLSRVGSFFADVGGAVVGAIAKGAEYVVKGAEYVGGGLLGLAAVGLDKVGLGGLVPGLVPPAYPTTPEAVAADQQRIQERFGDAISALPPAQRGMLEQMRALGLSDTDLLHGSHVAVEDGGALYDAWRKLPGVNERTSSHYGGGPPQQYELRFPDIGVVLFGKTPDGETFFQFEAHSSDDAFRHTADFFMHSLMGHQNIGPAGFSPHSEKEGQEIRVRG